MSVNKVAVFLAVASIAGVAHAGTILTPFIAGDFDGWAAPNSFTMTETFLGSDVWTASFAGLAAGSRHEFKVTDGTWGLTVPGGNNSWGFADGAGNLTLSYDGNTYADGWSNAVDRIGTSTDPAAWTAVGDWQNQVGGGDWDNANVNTVMAPQGGSIYSLTAVLAPGSYNWKAVVSGSWDSISFDERSVNTANWGFTTDVINDTVTFSVDALTGTARIDVVPEPATLGLVLFGLTAMVIRGRRR